MKLKDWAISALASTGDRLMGAADKLEGIDDEPDVAAEPEPANGATPPETDGLTKLNLGCNRHAMPGWTNVDIVPFRGVDVVADLRVAWPWQDATIEYIRAVDFIEHLPDPIHTMNEAWRVLKTGGTFEILVPSTDGRGAWQDPTHVSFWNTNSFFYYAVAPDEEGRLKSHPWRLLYAPHQIKAAFEVEIGESEPTDSGVIYVLAKLKKAPDPGDAEEPGK